jgi:hypothetical protein
VAVATSGSSLSSVRALGADLPLLDCGGMNRSLSQRMVEALQQAIRRHIDAAGSGSGSSGIDNIVNGRSLRDQHQIMGRFKPPQLLELVASIHSMTFVTSRSHAHNGSEAGESSNAFAASAQRNDAMATAMAVEHRLLGGVKQLHTVVLSALSRDALSDSDILEMFAQRPDKDKRLHAIHVARVCQYLCMSEEDALLVIQALKLQPLYDGVRQQNSERASPSPDPGLGGESAGIQQQLHAQSSVQAFSMLVLEASRVSERVLRVLGAKTP